jgi:hypothetical protein
MSYRELNRKLAAQKVANDPKALKKKYNILITQIGKEQVALNRLVFELEKRNEVGSDMSGYLQAVEAQRSKLRALQDQSGVLLGDYARALSDSTGDSVVFLTRPKKLSSAKVAAQKFTFRELLKSNGKPYSPRKWTAKDDVGLKKCDEEDRDLCQAWNSNAYTKAQAQQIAKLNGGEAVIE